MTIPKIIHQTYKSNNLPSLFKTCKNKIIELHPDFEYRFYTDHDMYTFINNKFPQYYSAFNKLPRTIMKIDMFRYFLMYEYGGLYTDMDYLMFKSFNLLHHNIVLPANREDNTGIPTCLGNCIFASRPNHPFWKLLIDSLFTIDRSTTDFSNDKNIDQNILGTGPMFVYHMWTEYSKENDDIFIPSRHLFHPPSNNNPEYIHQLTKSGAYGMHICSGVWRNNKL